MLITHRYHYTSVLKIVIRGEENGVDSKLKMCN